MKRIKHTVVGECWKYVGPLDNDGYGRIYFNSKSYQVHRVIYQLFVGPIPDNRAVKTTCGSRDCIRVSHLFISEKMKRDPVKFTHCKRGHEFKDPNIRYQKSGRTCKICVALRQRERNKAKKLNE